MTRERAKELLPVIQAYAEGRQIQYRPCGGKEWTSYRDFAFSREGDYRIKPEPREFWLNIYPDGGFTGPFKSRDEADRAASLARLECIRVREVSE